MPSTILTSESDQKNLFDLGRAIFKRRHVGRTTKARSQRHIRIPSSRGFWKSGLKKARKTWGKVLKQKQLKMQSQFEISSPLRGMSSTFAPNHFQAQTPSRATPRIADDQDHSRRYTAHQSTAITMPLLPNSNSSNGYRLSRLTVHEVIDEPLHFPPRSRRSVAMVHPLAGFHGVSAGSHSMSSDGNQTESGSAQGMPKKNPNSKSSSIYSSDYPAPMTPEFKRQVNPSRTVERRESEQEKRLSGDVLDDLRPRNSLRSQTSQVDAQGNTMRPASMVVSETPKALRPGARLRPVTMLDILPTHIEVLEPRSALPETPTPKKFHDSPEIDVLAVQGASFDGGGLTEKLRAISGVDDDTLAALEGRVPAITEPLQHYEIKAYGNASAYPGQKPYRESRYSAFQRGSTVKPEPVPAPTPVHSRPITPFTPHTTPPKGKNAADAQVQKNLEKEKVRRKAYRLSQMYDGVDLDVKSNSSRAQSPTTTAVSSPVQRKPVAKPRPYEIVAEKPLPALPIVRSQTAAQVAKTLAAKSTTPPPTALPPPPPAPTCQCSNCPSRRELAQVHARLASLEAQVTRKPVTASAAAAAAAASARAAATLHAAVVTTAAAATATSSGTVRREHRPDRHKERPAPTGSKWRDVVNVTKGFAKKW